VGFVRFSRQAKADLLDIWLWIAQDSVHTADRVIGELERRAAQLQDNPQLGPARPEIHPEARSLVVERWLVLYMQVDGGVMVVRVVDGARDLQKVL
jgi:toxin ParE1/3/4